MHKKEKIKLFFLFLGVVAVMAAFWLVLRHFEGGVDAKMTDEFLIDDTEQIEAEAVEADKSPVGTIKLNGDKYDYYDELETYLIIGTDASGNESGSGEEYRGNMADFLLLMVIDKTANEYGFLQLNRDAMTEVNLISRDGSGEATAEIQLCTAHWYGGNSEMSCNNTVTAVSKMLGGIPIDGYYAMNMDDIPKLNQEVGGVEVTLEEDFSDVDSAMVKGTTLTLTDEQAYHYIHDRYGVGDEKNTSRMKRQKQYMKGLMEKIKQKVKSEPAFLNKVFSKYKKEATTNISSGKLSRMAEAMNVSKSKGTLVLKGENKVGQALGDGIDHAEFYPSCESLVEVMTKLCNLQKRQNET